MFDTNQQVQKTAAHKKDLLTNLLMKIPGVHTQKQVDQYLLGILCFCVALIAFIIYQQSPDVETIPESAYSDQMLNE